MNGTLNRQEKNKRRVFTEEKSDDIGARLEHTPRKSLKRLAQESGVSTSSASRATQLLKLRPYKTTLIRAMVSTFCRRRWDRSASDILFSSQFIEFTSTPRSFLPSGESWCLVCCKIKKDCWTCVFNETIHCERCVQVILGQIFVELTKEVRLWLVSARLSYCTQRTYIYAGFVRYLRVQNYQQWYLVRTFTRS
jgi:hypothetical protein